MGGGGGECAAQGQSQLPVDSCGEAPNQFVCRDDEQCRTYVEQFITERIAPPRDDVGGLAASECIEGCELGPACACVFERPGNTFLDALDVVVLGGSATCDAYSRARYCAAPPEDFPGCALDDDASCQEPCAALHAELERDAMGRDVSVRAARCDMGRCASVWEVDDHCLVGSPIPSPDQPEVACSDDDAALLDAALAPTPVDAGPANADAGIATPRTASSGPIEPNWDTRREGELTWATAVVCGAEVGPFCVEGSCEETDAGVATDP